jgi:hypothetical protein
MASRLVDRWLPERTVDFQPGHLARLLAAGGFEDAPAWARLARPVDWRAWWLTSAMPAALAGAAPFRRRLARREAGPEGAALGPGGPRPFGARSSGAPAGLATPAPSAPAGSTDPRGDAIAPLAELATQVGLTLLARLVRR